MILALALSSCLSAVPHSWILDAPRSARLAVPADEVAEARVDQLNLSQLYAEGHRLRTQRPGIGGPITLLSIGGAGTFAFGGLTTFLISEVPKSNSGVGGFLIAFAAVVTSAATLLAIAGAIVGTVLFIRATNRRDAYAQRGVWVAARISEIESGSAIEPMPPSGVPTSLEQLSMERDIRGLQDTMPGLGLPIAMMASGAGGVFFALTPFLNSYNLQFMTAGNIAPYVVIGVVAAGLLAGGVVLLIKRIQDRTRIGNQITARRAGTNDAHPPGDFVLPAPPPLPPLNPELTPGGQPSAPPPPPNAWAPPPSPIAFSWAMSF